MYSQNWSNSLTAASQKLQFGLSNLVSGCSPQQRSCSCQHFICNSHKNSELLGFQIVKISQMACLQRPKNCNLVCQICQLLQYVMPVHWVLNCKNRSNSLPEVSQKLQFGSDSRQNLVCSSHKNSELLGFQIIEISQTACPQRPKNYNLVRQILSAAAVRWSPKFNIK